MTDSVDDSTAPSRRRSLRSAAVIGGVAIAADIIRSAGASDSNSNNLPPNVPEWMKVPGNPMGSQLYGTPSPFEKTLVKNIVKDLPQYLSASGRTPLQDLDGMTTMSRLATKATASRKETRQILRELERQDRLQLSDIGHRQ